RWRGGSRPAGGGGAAGRGVRRPARFRGGPGATRPWGRGGARGGAWRPGKGRTWAGRAPPAPFGRLRPGDRRVGAPRPGRAARRGGWWRPVPAGGRKRARGRGSAGAPWGKTAAVAGRRGRWLPGG